ncbi:MAG: sugar ABC transporter permease [Chloroflexota bacterium]|nr:sugar ABC transporter permease [Anaerolineae bacterium]HMM29644.1 sugar ABC transporter permease [Aggregatilineaceae bacterium]
MPYLLLLPSVALVAVFFIYPAVQSLELSLYRVHRVRGVKLYVGLENFQRLFESTTYLNSLEVTAKFVLAVVLFALAISLALAVGASQPIRGFGVYRTLLIWTYALSPAIAGLIWALLTDPAIGFLTDVLKTFGIDFNWRRSQDDALIFVTMAAVWKILGYNILFFLAGLKNIPRDVIEAASLDGANAWTRFWKMIFPLLMPVTLFLLIMNTLYASFETFGLIDITTQGGPGRATNVLVYNLYNDGFKSTSGIGLASAQSIILLGIVAALTVFQYRFVSRRTFYQ